MAAYHKVEVSLGTNALTVGVLEAQTVNVVLPTVGPQGEVGAVGPTGPTGSTGPANSLAIGTVTTGAEGSGAAAVITGTAPSQTLSLTIPVGATGATGPANSLDIGTVSTGAPGSNAAATVTGTAPAQTLNLTIPRGDVGATGATGAVGPQGPAGTATTDASELTTGTLDDARLSGNVALKDAANTFTQNQTLDGTNNTAPNQTAASGSSIMTRDLGDARFSRWENSHEITNFTGVTAGIVSGGSTTLASGSSRLRGAASGAFRSFWSIVRGTLTGATDALDAGAWRQRVIVSLFADIRCLAGWYPVLGGLSAQWSGRGIGTTAGAGAVYPYFMFRDEAWRAMKHTFVRGSASVFPVRASNVVTVETNGAHGLVAGDFVHVAGVLPQSMQTYRAEVTGVPTSTSFTYANTGADETATTILGDNMQLAKIEELGSVATTSSSNLFTGTQTWDLAIAVDGSGGATFYANGTVVATGSGFRVAATANVARAGFGLQSLATATTISDLYIYKLEHTINP